MPTTPSPCATDPASPGHLDGAEQQPDVAFARHPTLGLVAAASDDADAGLPATVLRHFGFTLDSEHDIWRLPDRMLWIDQVLTAAQASTLLTGLGHTVVADEETRTTALALAAQHAPPARSPGAALVQMPAHNTPMPPASAPLRR